MKSKHLIKNKEKLTSAFCLSHMTAYCPTWLSTLTTLLFSWTRGKGEVLNYYTVGQCIKSCRSRASAHVQTSEQRFRNCWSHAIFIHNNRYEIVWYEKPKTCSEEKLCCWKNASLMRDVREEWPGWFELTVIQMTTHYIRGEQKGVSKCTTAAAEPTLLQPDEVLPFGLGEPVPKCELSVFADRTGTRCVRRLLKCIIHSAQVWHFPRTCTGNVEPLPQQHL